MTYSKFYLDYKTKIGGTYMYEFKTSDNDFVRLFKLHGIIKQFDIYLNYNINRLFEISIDSSNGHYVPIVKFKRIFAASEIDSIKTQLDSIKSLCEEICEIIKYVLRDEGENDNDWSNKAEYKY